MRIGGIPRCGTPARYPACPWLVAAGSDAPLIKASFSSLVIWLRSLSTRGTPVTTGTLSCARPGAAEKMLNTSNATDAAAAVKGSIPDFRLNNCEEGINRGICISDIFALSLPSAAMIGLALSQMQIST